MPITEIDKPVCSLNLLMMAVFENPYNIDVKECVFADVQGIIVPHTSSQSLRAMANT